MRILLIDDDEMFSLLLQEMLEPAGYTLFWAPGPRDGIEMFKEILPDLVLLDVHMPEMSGCEVAPILKKIAEKNSIFIPIIFFTSSRDDHELVACLDSGGDDLIGKPFNENLLEVKLRAWKRNIKLINENKKPPPPKGLSQFSKSHLSEEELFDLLSLRQKF
ncbi:MAG: response regulator transcription factor [Magnetococcales bacterium]|nr:response regulator transcription factor [Magnetococcales bacterium]